MENENKRFSDWEEVDCQECARWWDSSCDGVFKGHRTLCNSFLATRNVLIPAQIKRLQNVVKGLVWAVLCLSAAFIIHLIWS